MLTPILDALPYGSIVEVPRTPGHISYLGMKQVNALLIRRYGVGLDHTFEDMWVTDDGKFPRRVSAWYKKRWGISLTPDLTEMIGNIARPTVETVSSTMMDFDRKLNWIPGQFNDPDSCYWGEHNDARSMLRKHRSAAVRYWEKLGFNDLNGQARKHLDGIGWIGGVGRAWLIEDEVLPPGSILLFNLYAESPAPQFVAPLADYLHMQYHVVAFSNRGETTGMLYINNDAGWLIGPKEQIEHRDEINLDWRGVREFCSYCDDLKPIKSLHPIHGRLYCTSCRNSECNQCAICKDWVTDDDSRQDWQGDSDKTICWPCIEKGKGNFCSQCHKVFVYGTPPDLQDKPWCPKCKAKQLEGLQHEGVAGRGAAKRKMPRQ